MRTFLTLILVIFLSGFSLLVAPPLLAADLAGAPTVDSTQGAQIFEVHCVGCHLNGGNIVRRGKTLKLKALQRNGIDSVASIAQLVTNGKGNMSAYRDRLSEAEIQTVAAYVLEQAQKNWQK